jgi:hypothetical protein
MPIVMPALSEPTPRELPSLINFTDHDREHTLDLLKSIVLFGELQLLS